MLNAVARTLRLDAAERDYLINLAGHRPTGHRGAGPRPGVIRMMAALTTQAAFVLGPRMEVLAGNSLAWALLHGFPAEPDDRRNLMRWVLTDPAARQLYEEWAVVASDLVGALQVESSARPADPQIAALVGEPATRSPEFRTWWAEPCPQGRTPGTKRFDHRAPGRDPAPDPARTRQGRPVREGVTPPMSQRRHVPNEPKASRHR
ncbi:hypothetical protein KOI35_19155 [Actinoplanes bogorensis]|uniref:MmyB-like transcription regulator ligand binding domain-containing protein n=1 Tax=Paractinoplanes bogorensis TaxID=1610840 RepID=A0ABS5YQB0_9ACTN|nr:hypothetical protein [Actinoplanes bogorensis]MBU2665632.1 hypothetical protein [Actinoplanes bogorensis]